MRLKILLGLIFILLFFSTWFWLAGGLAWLRGWMFIGLLIVGRSLSTFYIKHKDPELLRRRGQIGQGTKNWDIALLTLFGFTYLVILVVAAIDAQHRWSTMPRWLWPIGAVLYGLFEGVMTWAMAVNTHFEKTVRIQRDRNHRVIQSGPYRIIRHPGYIATLLGFVLATPLLLGSWWAFVPALLAAFCLILRTALEDQTLRKELTGYEAYTGKVRYRLFPGLW